MININIIKQTRRTILIPHYKNIFSNNLNYVCSVAYKKKEKYYAEKWDRFGVFVSEKINSYLSKCKQIS
jgi:hypothetical protein